MVAIVFFIYGFLLCLEAVMAYRQDSGRPSLIAGIVSGTLVIAAAAMVLLGVSIGPSVGLGVILAMMGVFGSRLMRTRAFMPAGLMFVASIVALGILFRGLE